MEVTRSLANPDEAASIVAKKDRDLMNFGSKERKKACKRSEGLCVHHQPHKQINYEVFHYFKLIYCFIMQCNVLHNFNAVLIQQQEVL
jgi:hypothetical protein